MASLELLCHFIGIDSKKFSKEENLILEAKLYAHVSKELWKSYRSQYEEYFNLFEYNIDMENMIMELNFIRCLINDILKSESYTLSGIAYYTQTPEEVIQDLLIGYKISPAIAFTRRLIELDKLIRPELYHSIMKKITSDLN